MTWNTQDTNLSSYVPKANVDHTIRGYQHLIPLGHHTKGYIALLYDVGIGIVWSP